MLIVNSKGRKTGSDTIRSYNEISESSYVRSSGVEGNEFYDLAMTLIDGETYQIKVFGKHNGLYSMCILLSWYKGEWKYKTENFDNVQIKKGEVHNYTLKFSLTAPMEIKRVN